MNSDTLVLRQIHPVLVQSGHIATQAFISSQAFTPTSKDEGRLSVYNGAKFSAESAFEHYMEELKLVSVGVVAVSVAECEAEGRNVEEDNDPFDGHTFIDYNGISKSEIRRVAKTLRDRAVKRGWLFQRREA
jgi:hypothetical protein